MDKSVPAPKVNLSSVVPLLSPNTIFLVLTSRLPPSCGEVSVTMFNAVRLAPLPLNAVATAVPVTVIPVLVVASFTLQPSNNSTLSVTFT